MCSWITHAGQYRYGKYTYSSSGSDQWILSVVGTREGFNCLFHRPKLSLRWSQVFSIPSTLQTDHKPPKVIPYPLRIYNIHIVCVFVLFVVAAYFVPKKCFTMSSEHPHIESNTAYRTARIMQLLYNLVIFCYTDIVRLSFGIGGPVLQALCLCMVVPVISRRKLIQIKGFTRRVFGYHADN